MGVGRVLGKIADTVSSGARAAGRYIAETPTGQYVGKAPGRLHRWAWGDSELDLVDKYAPWLNAGDRTPKQVYEAGIGKGRGFIPRHMSQAGVSGTASHELAGVGGLSDVQRNAAVGVAERRLGTKPELPIISSQVAGETRIPKFPTDLSIRKTNSQLRLDSLREEDAVELQKISKGYKTSAANERLGKDIKTAPSTYEELLDKQDDALRQLGDQIPDMSYKQRRKLRREIKGEVRQAGAELNRRRFVGDHLYDHHKTYEEFESAVAHKPYGKMDDWVGGYKSRGRVWASRAAWGIGAIGAGTIWGAGAYAMGRGKYEDPPPVLVGGGDRRPRQTGAPLNSDAGMVLSLHDNRRSY